MRAKTIAINTTRRTYIYTQIRFCESFDDISSFSAIRTMIVICCQCARETTAPMVATRCGWAPNNIYIYIYAAEMVL